MGHGFETPSGLHVLCLLGLTRLRPRSPRPLDVRHQRDESMAVRTKCPQVGSVIVAVISVDVINVELTRMLCLKTAPLTPISEELAI